jgi:hypothetical protein
MRSYWRRRQMNWRWQRQNYEKQVPPSAATVTNHSATATATATITKSLPIAMGRRSPGALPGDFGRGCSSNKSSLSKSPVVACELLAPQIAAPPPPPPLQSLVPLLPIAVDQSQPQPQLLYFSGLSLPRGMCVYLFLGKINMISLAMVRFDMLIKPEDNESSGFLEFLKAGSICAIFLFFSGILLYQSTVQAASISGPGNSSTLLLFCIGLQPTALIICPFLWKRHRFISIGLLAGMLLVDLVFPGIVLLYAIYLCQSGPCPLGLS